MKPAAIAPDVAGHVIGQDFIVRRVQNFLFQPRRIGGVPHQRMATHRHAVRSGEGGQLVGAGKIEPARLRLHDQPFQLVFRHQDVGFARQHGSKIGIGKLIRTRRRAEQNPARRRKVAQSSWACFARQRRRSGQGRGRCQQSAPVQHGVTPP